MTCLLLCTIREGSMEDINQAPGEVNAAVLEASVTPRSRRCQRAAGRASRALTTSCGVLSI